MDTKDFRDTVYVIFGTGLAILTGYARQSAIAHELGASRIADIYLVAFALPEFVIIAMPIILTPAFIPVFLSVRQSQGENFAWQFVKRVALVVIIFLLALTALTVISAPYFLSLISPGFNLSERQEAMFALYPMLPSLILIGMATFASSISQTYRSFVRPALMTTIYNLTFIAVLFFLPLSQPIIRASWAVTIGAVTSLLFILPLIMKWVPARSVRPENQSTDASIKEWFSLTIPYAIGYAAHHLILFIDRAMATDLGAGSAAALFYAYHLTLVIVQLSGLAVSTVLFPKLADQVAGGDLLTAKRSLVTALTLVWRIVLPASAGLILIRKPVVRILFEHGAFDTQATELVSSPVIWYSIAVLADALCQPLWRAVYSRRSGWTFVAINSLQTGIRILANLVLIHWLGYTGLAISATIGLAFQAAALLWWAKSKFTFSINSKGWQDITSTAIAALLAILGSSLLYNIMDGDYPILTILIISVFGTLIYISALYGSKRIMDVHYGT